MKRINLILKISLFSFIFFGIITVALFFLVDNKNKVIYETKTQEFDTVSYIDISVLDFDVQISPHSSDRIKLEYFSDVDLEVEFKEDMVVVSQKSRMSVPVILHDKKEKYLNVYLPNDTYNYIRVINSAGDTKVDRIVSEVFDCSAKNGAITLEKVSGNATLVTSGGEINASILDFDELKINTNEGNANVTIPKSDKYNLKFTSTQGELNAFFLENQNIKGEAFFFRSDDSREVYIKTKKGTVMLAPISE